MLTAFVDPCAQASILCHERSGWFASVHAKAVDFIANGLPDRDVIVSIYRFFGDQWSLAEL
jgi:hypothetical protein